LTIISFFIKIEVNR